MAYGLAAVWLVGAAALAPAADGGALVAEMWQRHRAVQSEREEHEILVVQRPQAAPFTRTDVEALLRDVPSGVAHKRAVRHVLFGSDHEDKLHLLFSLPPEDAGLGLLIWRRPATQDQMWLYMPGYHRVRRMPASSDQKLAGTNFLYEDVRALAGERRDDFTYAAPTADTIDGRAADLVVATPKADTATAYAQRKVWIDKAWLFPLQVEFADRSGKPWKRLRQSEIREAAPGTYRADLVEMRDLQRDETTIVLVTKRQVGVAIPPQVFTEDYLVHPGND